jgi:hypothetical protein
LAEGRVVVVEVGDTNVGGERLFRLEDPLYELLSLQILRMRLACKNDLQRPGLGGDGAQPVQTAEEEVSALVSGDAPGESERQHV